MQISEYYGASNQTRKEGEEKQGKESLQYQTYTDSGSIKKKKSIIVYIENSSFNEKPFVVEDIMTVSELIEKVCERFPKICLNTIALRVFTCRLGAIPRHELIDSIPGHLDNVYIHLSLRKHPRLPGM